MSMLHPNGSYCARQVAELVFKKSVTWFYKNHAELTRRGFPAPISPLGHPRWSGQRLLHWMGSPQAAPAGVPRDLSNVLDMRTAAMRLNQRKRA